MSDIFAFVSSLSWFAFYKNCKIYPTFFGLKSLSCSPLLIIILAPERLHIFLPLIVEQLNCTILQEIIFCCNLTLLIQFVYSTCEIRLVFHLREPVQQKSPLWFLMRKLLFLFCIWTVPFINVELVSRDFSWRPEAYQSLVVFSFYAHLWTLQWDSC